MGSLRPSSNFRWSVDGRVRIKMSYCCLDLGCRGAPVSAGAVNLFHSRVPVRGV